MNRHSSLIKFYKVGSVIPVLKEFHPVRLAQLVERGTLNIGVVGSNPTLGELTFCAKISRAIGFSQELKKQNQIIAGIA